MMMVQKFTYTLGRSLYVPVTSRCNSVPLPYTRGPNFTLPRDIAETLLRFRETEQPGSVPPEMLEAWLGGGDDDDEEKVRIPPYTQVLVNCLYPHQTDDLLRTVQDQKRNRELMASVSAEAVPDPLQPSIASLIDEVESMIDEGNNSARGGGGRAFDSVVIAGEGEPTLRMDACLALARRVSTMDDPLPVRLITNGLVYSIPNFGYSPFNAERNGILPLHRHTVLKDMLEAGITEISVALNTANRHEYDVMMEPCCHTGGGRIGADADDPGLLHDGSHSKVDTHPGTAHDIVCEFIMEAKKIFPKVEITGVDRPGIDKKETTRLARLLSSVNPDKNKRGLQVNIMRWRRYFPEEGHRVNV
ncbi:hypothetical protein THAOC_02002 [Thalassiosira oceanica]|uniref:Uncharacterized protein n=1 Tax=Thalassiosira oceanica TaxID=159749 RepID=K0TQL3_THAOC|nr:hypothetical protein THAOC_02002 [Thalassiosira oceanica]|eukprot:EJK76247.1 hypothetical protein THAOC_02002 [Thalassiosira oceanica]